MGSYQRGVLQHCVLLVLLRLQGLGVLLHHGVVDGGPRGDLGLPAPRLGGGGVVGRGGVGVAVRQEGGVACGGGGRLGRGGGGRGGGGGSGFGLGLAGRGGRC